jgi:UDP-4-amino-4,6-dideoxy-N-acetyl-beta-L-altrosamine N-acetyltransferase
MIIENYGIQLERIEFNHLMMIRDWRNSDFIKMHMHFKGHITEKMQIDWFGNINNDFNYYFLIIDPISNEYCGLVNVKDINYTSKEAESGFYVSKPQYLGSNVVVRAIFSLYDFAFDNLQLNQLNVKVLNTNTNAISFNINLGTKFDLVNENLSYGKLYKLDYFKKTEKIKKYITKNNPII